MEPTMSFPTPHTWNPTLPEAHTWNPTYPADYVDDPMATPPPVFPPVPTIPAAAPEHVESISQIYEKMTTLLAGDQTEVVIHEQDNELTSIILIAVIVVVLVVFLCVLLVIRYSLKHKGSYYTQEDKGGHWGDADDAMLKAGHSFQDLDEDV